MNLGRFRSSIVGCLAMTAGAGLAHAQLSIPPLDQNIKTQYVNKSKSLYQTLLDIPDMDPEDRDTLFRHYRDINRSYVATPLQSYMVKLSEAAKDYDVAVNAAITAATKALGSPVNDKLSKPSFKTCVNDGEVKVSDLDDAQKNVNDSWQGLYGTLNNPGSSPRKAISSLETWDSSGLGRASSALSAKWKERVDQCCSQYQTKDGKPSDDVCASIVAELKKAGEKAVPQLPNPNPPDPVSDLGLKPKAVAQLLDWQSQNVRGIRKNNSEVGDGDSEEQYLQSTLERCKQKVSDRQKKANSPIDTELVTGVAKSLKCDLLPFLTTQYASTSTQKMTLAVTSADIKGKDWDVNCDPAMMAQWDAMRPTDPNAIAKKWGLDSLSNPAYIQNMRNITPVQSSYPITASIYGVTTPYSLTGLTASTVNSGGTPTGGRGSFSGVTSSTTTSTSSSGSSLGRGTFTGITRNSGGMGSMAGRSVTTGVRRLSREVEGGASPIKAATTLQSGAYQTRTLATRMVSNNQSIGSGSAVRSANAASARVAKAAITNASNARVQLVTAGSVLNGVRGVQGAQTGTSVSGTGSGSGTSVGTIQQDDSANQASRNRINALAAVYQQNIQTAQDLANTYANKIQTQLAGRDSLIQAAISDMLEMTVAKQAERMNQLRRELLTVDRDLGTLKSEYDVACSSIKSQSALMNTIYAYGSNAPNYNGNGSVLLPGRNTNGSFLNRQWMDRIQKILRPLAIIPEAFGAVKSFTKQEELEWSQAWNKFVSDYEVYTEQKKAEELKARKELQALLENYRNGITEQTARDTDTETLIIMDQFARAVQTETQDLETKSLPPNLMSVVKNANREAGEARDALNKIALQYKDSYPTSYETNPEVWWGMMQQALIY